MEFNTYFNPAILVLGVMVWIGIFGVIGIYLDRSNPKADSKVKTPQQKDKEC